MRLPAPLAGIEGGVHGDTQYDGAQPVSCRSQVDPVGDLALVCEHYEATVEAVGRSSRAGTLLGGDLMSASLDWVAALQVGPLAAIEAGLAREGWGVLLGDDSGRPVAASATGLRILGRSESEYMAMPMVMSALAPTTLRGLAGRRRRRAAGVPVPDVVEMEVVGADGGSCLCTAFIAHVDDAARGTLMVVVLRPQRPSLEIRDALKRTGPLFDAIGIGVVMWTFDAEDALRLVDVNDRAGAILGRDIRAKCGDLLDEIFPESHSFEAAARTLKSMARGSSHRLADVDGARFGDAHPARFRRLVVNLGGGLVAVLFVDVIEAVSAEMRERALLGELLADDDARRRMIADDLHDEQVQQLTVAAYELDAAARSEPNSATLLAAADQIRDAIEGLRQTMFGLNPPLPDATPLAEQISSAAQFIFAGTGVQVATAFDRLPDGTSDVQAGLARIANEAMLNVRRHAGAKHVSVEVSVDGDSITLRVTDDGRMMEAAAALGHQGLRTMRERALALGGVVEVDLSASGSRVTAIVPVADPVRARRADLAAAGALGERLLGELRDDLDRLESTRAEAAKRADHVKSRLDALDAFAHLIEHPSTPSLVWRRLAQSWSKCFGGAVAVRTPDPMNSSLVLRAMWHESPGQRVGYSRWLPESRPLTTQSTVTTTVTTHRAAIASVSELAAGAVGTPGFSPPHSALALPLHLPGGGVGVIEKYRDLDPEPFSNEDLSLLRIAATLAAQFVARSTLPSPSPNHS